MLSPGVQLETLCQEARSELLLVAPFIKFSAFKRLLTSVAKDVKVVCVTRWRPEEIAAGVSDIEIWHTFQERELSSLWLRHDLHAKYFRADRKCLIGSANITSSALGWANPSNYELLISVPVNDALTQFEHTLFAGSIQAQLYIYEEVKLAAANIGPLNLYVPADTALEEPLSDTSRHSPQTWLPLLRNPEALFLVYRGMVDSLTTSTIEAAKNDLQVLCVPSGLDKDLFEKYVAAILLQQPIVLHVDSFAAVPRRFGEMKALLGRLAEVDPHDDFDASRAWQTLMRWLLHFLPTRYTQYTPRHSEIFVRRI